MRASAILFDGCITFRAQKNVLSDGIDQQSVMSFTLLQLKLSVLSAGNIRMVKVTTLAARFGFAGCAIKGAVQTVDNETTNA